MRASGTQGDINPINHYFIIKHKDGSKVTQAGFGLRRAPGSRRWRGSCVMPTPPSFSIACSLMLSRDSTMAGVIK